MLCTYLESFSKIPQEWNFMKILSVRAELFHADRRMDGQTDKSRFLQFYESAQKRILVRTIACIKTVPAY